MTFVRRLMPRRSVSAAAVAAVTVLIAATAYAASTSVTTSSKDTVISLGANTNLSVTGGEKVPLLTLDFPRSSKATHYVLAAQGDLVNFGPSDYTRCDLVVNGNEIASVSTIVGDPTPGGTQGPAAFLSPFSLTGAATVPASGGTGVLQCWHDNTNGATPYVDSNASVWAHRTGSLKTATE
jgi:hypothetical protein